MTKLITLTAAAVSGLTFAGAALAQPPATPSAAKPARAERSCFSLSDWNGWSSPSRDVLYMKVRQRDVYRVDLAHGTNQLSSPGSYIVNVVRGSDQVCAPIDLDLRVSDGFMDMPIRAKTITKLTPEEIAAIPKKDRP
ncbi:MAG: hypothetical protein KKC14_06600 [Alphaproteobacteria bacterium]|nr:hypothetical protein [Alphaproteobacteria bacterium]